MSIFCFQWKFMWCVKTNKLTNQQRKRCDWKCRKITKISANWRHGKQVTVKIIGKDVVLRENDAGNGTQTSMILVILDN